MSVKELGSVLDAGLFELWLLMAWHDMKLVSQGAGCLFVCLFLQVSRFIVQEQRANGLRTKLGKGETGVQEHTDALQHEWRCFT